MSERTRSYKESLLVPIILCFVCSVLFLVYTYLNDQWRFSYHAKIENFSVCNADQSVPEGNVIEIEPQVETSNQVNICGTFEAAVPAGFSMLIYKKPSENPVSIAFHEVENGDFFFVIPLPEEDIAGIYRVEVEFRRNIIATTEFTIITR